MARINLLPWREERREELKKEFIAILGAVVVAALGVVFAWNSIVSGQIESQKSRNAYLQKHIDELTLQVQEISQLRKEREQLVERMRVIQELQGNRPEIVHVFDEIARAVPDGVFYTKIERKGKQIEFVGTAESNNRVSSLMRRLDASEWFTNPNLTSVKANPDFGEQANDFVLSVTIQVPEPEAKSDDDEVKSN